MKRVTRITKGGQVSIPAEVRHRWVTQRVEIIDKGDELVVRPLPADPVDALLGSMPALMPGMTSDRMRELDHQDERIAEASKDFYRGIV